MDYVVYVLKDKMKKHLLVGLLTGSLLLTACSSNEATFLNDTMEEPLKDELVAEFKKNMKTSSNEVDSVKVDAKEDTEEEVEENKKEEVNAEGKPETKTETKEETSTEAESEPKPQPKKSNSEIAKEVMAGKWGSGAERKKRLVSAGYDTNTIQSEVNKLSPKPAQSTSNNNSSSNENKNNQSSKYRANYIYVGGTSMPMRVTSYSNLQQMIDSTTYTWVGFEKYSPNDNKGTYLAQHNHTGGGVVLNLTNGNKVIATDGNGTPHNYVVSKVLYNQEAFTDEIRGQVNKEYLVLQTSEKRINGQRVGNRIVIVDKQ